MNDTGKGFYASIPCGQCQAGQMRQEFVTYLTWIGDELITVPDFPAWICDVCGRREYDPQALNQLSLLLSPTAGKPTARKHPQRKRTTPVRRKRTPRSDP